MAAIILLEKCRLRLDDPVDRLLPELSNRRMVRRIKGPVDDTVPAERPITIRDLLTFRMGFGGYSDPCPVNAAAAPLQLGRMRDELLAIEIFDTLLEAQVLVSNWHDEYNNCRPHSALGMVTPPSSLGNGGPTTHPNPRNRWTYNWGPGNYAVA